MSYLGIGDMENNLLQRALFNWFYKFSRPLGGSQINALPINGQISAMSIDV